MRLTLLVSLTVCLMAGGFSLAHGFDSWGLGHELGFQPFSGPTHSGPVFSNEQWDAANAVYQSLSPEWRSSGSDTFGDGTGSELPGIFDDWGSGSPGSDSTDWGFAAPTMDATGWGFAFGDTFNSGLGNIGFTPFW